jgi:hypothetical protein
LGMREGEGAIQKPSGNVNRVPMVLKCKFPRHRLLAG